MRLDTPNPTADQLRRSSASHFDGGLERGAPTPLGPALAARRRLDVVGLVVLIATSALLRLEGRAQWLWIDEGLTVGIASHRAVDIPGLMRGDGSPPLFYLVMHGWMRLFGESETALHALSLTLALLTIPVAWWAARRLFGPRAGAIAAVLAALNPFLTFYGREARMYTLVALLSVVAATTFVLAFAEGQRRYLPAFVVATVLLLYSHNWGLFFIVAAALALVPCARGRHRAIAADARLAFGIIAVAYLPWVPTLIGQARHTGAPWSAVPSIRQAVSEVSAVLGDERVLVALLLAGGAGVVAMFTTGGAQPRRQLVALALLCTVPVVLSWLTSQVEPNWATRYFAIILGPLILVAAAALARAGWQGIAALGLIVLFWTQPLGRLSGDRPVAALSQKANVKAVVRQVQPYLHDGDLVVVTHPEQTPVVAYYLRRLGAPPVLHFATPLGAPADPGVFDWRDAPARLRAATANRKLVPLLTTLRPGAHIVVFAPVGDASPDDPEWIHLFHTRSAEWIEALDAQPGVRLTRQVGSPTEEVTGASLYARVYTVGARP